LISLPRRSSRSTAKGSGRARVTQILNYTLLAPDIQAEILKLPLVEPGGDRLAERRVRTVIREARWDEQRKLWRALLKECPWPAQGT